MGVNQGRAKRKEGEKKSKKGKKISVEKLMYHWLNRWDLGYLYLKKERKFKEIYIFT